MKITTAVFDLDGTLLDTVQDLAEASNEVLSHFGFAAHPVAAYNTFVGDGLSVLMQRVTPENTDEATIEKCCNLFMDVYDSCWDRSSRPYPGIEDMLERLKVNDITCCVLSNKPHAFTVKCVDRFFEPELFAHVFGQREGVPRKPDPAGALEAARLSGADVGQCLYVGDTSVDMMTGKRAGMFTVGVLWGFRAEKELVENGADLLVANPMEIVEYVVSAG